MWLSIVIYVVGFYLFATFFFWPMLFSFVARMSAIELMYKRQPTPVYATGLLSISVLVYVGNKLGWMNGVGAGLTMLFSALFFLLKSYDATPVPGFDDVDLTGKVAVITGGNNGIGYCTAEALLSKGASVVIASRNEKKGKEAVERMIKATNKAGAIFLPLDLADNQSIHDFAAAIPFPKVDILVLNSGFIPRVSAHKDGEIEPGMQAMHFGHFLLFALLLPKLREAEKEGQVRVHLTSSVSHTICPPDNYVDDSDLRRAGQHHFMHLYGRAKMANMLMTNEIHRRSRDLGLNVVATCCHPGGVYTGIWFWPRLLPGLLKKEQNAIFDFFASHIMRAPEHGAHSLVFGAASPLCTKGGEYYIDCGIEKKKNGGDSAERSRNLWNLSVRLCDSELPAEIKADPFMEILD